MASKTQPITSSTASSSKTPCRQRSEAERLPKDIDQDTATDIVESLSEAARLRRQQQGNGDKQGSAALQQASSEQEESDDKDQERKESEHDGEEEDVSSVTDNKELEDSGKEGSAESVIIINPIDLTTENDDKVCCSPPLPTPIYDILEKYTAIKKEKHTEGEDELELIVAEAGNDRMRTSSVEAEEAEEAEKAKQVTKTRKKRQRKGDLADHLRPLDKDELFVPKIDECRATVAAFKEKFSNSERALFAIRAGFKQKAVDPLLLFLCAAQMAMTSATVPEYTKKSELEKLKKRFATTNTNALRRWIGTCNNWHAFVTTSALASLPTQRCLQPTRKENTTTGPLTLLRST
ncbi:hypothetical protein DFJ77DRAFT_439106 [Powellomyces hirtus]|nr:hypothetical protein DFJ77DRAFT_439106 [Powellomyces hirtus]